MAAALHRGGAKGQRFYDWALITLTPPDNAANADRDVDRDVDRGVERDTACWWLLVRRHRDTDELAFYRCYSPHMVPLRELVRVAGRRWTVEESFQAGKGLAGLDEHQVRRWTSWRRWTLLAMTAHALLAVIAANEHTDHPTPAGQIALTCNEIRGCSPSWSSSLLASWPAPKPGRHGDDDTSTEPGPVTTGGRTPRTDGRNDLRLEY